VGRVIFAVQPNDLNDAHLQQLVQSRYLIVNAQYPLDRFWHRAVGQKDERVPLARRVRLGSEERLHQFGSVRDEMFEFAVDRVDGEHGVFAHVRMAVFETRSTGWDKGFKEFAIFGYFLEKAECCTTDVFIGVLLNAK
jgi:hypothetical protein